METLELISIIVGIVSGVIAIIGFIISDKKKTNNIAIHQEYDNSLTNYGNIANSQIIQITNPSLETNKKEVVFFGENFLRIILSIFVLVTISIFAYVQIEEYPHSLPLPWNIFAYMIDVIKTTANFFTFILILFCIIKLVDYLYSSHYKQNTFFSKFLNILIISLTFTSSVLYYSFFRSINIPEKIENHVIVNISNVNFLDSLLNIGELFSLIISPMSILLVFLLFLPSVLTRGELNNEHKKAVLTATTICSILVIFGFLF